MIQKAKNQMDQKIVKPKIFISDLILETNSN